MLADDTATSLLVNTPVTCISSAVSLLPLSVMTVH